MFFIPLSHFLSLKVYYHLKINNEFAAVRFVYCYLDRPVIKVIINNEFAAVRFVYCYLDRPVIKVILLSVVCFDSSNYGQCK